LLKNCGCRLFFSNRPGKMPTAAEKTGNNLSAAGTCFISSRRAQRPAGRPSWLNGPGFPQKPGFFSCTSPHPLIAYAA